MCKKLVRNLSTVFKYLGRQPRGNGTYKQIQLSPSEPFISYRKETFLFNIEIECQFLVAGRPSEIFKMRVC